MQSFEAVIDFWFVRHGQDDWFGGRPAFDRLIAERFGDTHARVAMGEAWRWRESADGRLAEIVVLDQFSRHLFRGQARAFAQDPMALTLAQEMVAQGLDRQVERARRGFVYLPYMHSESAVVHEEALRLYTEFGDAESLDYEVRHRDCILRFGRYPFRNAALGRESSAAELAYMQQAGTRGF